MVIKTNVHSQRQLNEIKELLCNSRQALNAFALSLTGDQSRADDLVQTTFLKAWSCINSYIAGTNMQAWLFTILRNTHFSNYRRGRRETCWSEVLDNDISLSTGMGEGAAAARHDFRLLLKYLFSLSREKTDALIAVAYLGMSYEETAALLRCAEGTIKSRVNRARLELVRLMEVGISGQTDYSWSASATKGVLTSDPYYLIARTYEELYAQLDVGPKVPKVTVHKKVAKITTPVDVEALWKTLVESGALDQESEDLASLMQSSIEEYM